MGTLGRPGGGWDPCDDPIDGVGVADPGGRTSAPAETIRPGDTILPPERELSLWMRRHAREHGLSEAALHLTVLAVREGAPDRRGRWLIVETRHADEWSAGRAPRPFTFKARPATRWPIIRRAGLDPLKGGR
jgi:hypothetical protein